jgi:hypothetical protein
MKAYFSGQSVRVQSEHPLEDALIAEFENELPHMSGLMPDGSRGIELTIAEAQDYAFGPDAEANIILMPAFRSTRLALCNLFAKYAAHPDCVDQGQLVGFSY